MLYTTDRNLIDSVTSLLCNAYILPSSWFIKSIIACDSHENFNFFFIGVLNIIYGVFTSFDEFRAGQEMTKHWPLLDTEGARTGWSGSRRTGRPRGIASCTSPRSSGWTSSQRCAERSCKASQPQVQLKTEGGGGAKARQERRPTRGRTLPPSRARVRPRCPPSWCGTESSSSPWPSQCIPSAGAAPCWRLCRPDIEGNQKVYHNRYKLADIRSNEKLEVYLQS